MADAEQARGFIHLIENHWEFLVSLGGMAAGAVAFVWYTLKRTIPDIIDRINSNDKKTVESINSVKEEISRIRSDQVNLDRRALELGYAKKRDFYDEKGLPLFQLRTGCLEMRNNCSDERTELKSSICKKMEEVKAQLASNVRAIHETLREQSDEAADQADQIKDVLNTVKTIVEKDRQTERREEMLEMVEALGDKLADSIVGKIKKDQKVGSGR